MQREIKFRMFRDGRMQQVHTMYSKASDGRDRSPVSDDPEYNLSFSEEDNLMQFTGFKDKNGKQIYEGDIVRTTHGKGTVFFDDKCAAFKLDWSETDMESDVSWFPFRGMRTSEVIGNIHETQNC